MRIVTSHSDAETRALGREIGTALEPAQLVALSGDLGSGKTELVRGMCEALDCADEVSSPSFTLINEYEGSTRVAHCDLYRLSSEEEMFEIGLEELFRSDAIILVEWAERARSMLPVPRLEILCEHGAGEDERRYTIHHCHTEDDSLLGIGSLRGGNPA